MNKILIWSGSEGWMHTLMKNQIESLQFNCEDIFLICLGTACKYAKKCWFKNEHKNRQFRPILW